MSIFEEVFGRGYNRERAYECRYDSQREDEYMICGECGEAPHEGPCESEEPNVRRLAAMGEYYHYCHN